MPNTNYASNRREQPNDRGRRSDNRQNDQQNVDYPDRRIGDHIKNLKGGLGVYQVREMINDAESLGKYLATVKKLKTNQIRKFLDTLKQLKAQKNQHQDPDKGFLVIKDSVQLLRPQLAYAASKKGERDDNPVVPLKKVLDEAIKKVEGNDDFERLVQLVEAIVAYHKAEGGRDQ